MLICEVFTPKAMADCRHHNSRVQYGQHAKAIHQDRTLVWLTHQVLRHLTNRFHHASYVMTTNLNLLLFRSFTFRLKVVRAKGILFTFLNKLFMELFSTVTFVDPILSSEATDYFLCDLDDHHQLPALRLHCCTSSEFCGKVQAAW